MHKMQIRVGNKYPQGLASDACLSALGGLESEMTSPMNLVNAPSRVGLLTRFPNRGGVLQALKMAL